MYEPINVHDLIEGPLCSSLKRRELTGSNSSNYSGIIFSVAYDGGNLKEVLRDINSAGQTTLLIDPEGGFTEEEVTIAFNTGFKEASLGSRILRTETAPRAAIIMIQYELGDME